MKFFCYTVMFVMLLSGCSKKQTDNPQPPAPKNITAVAVTVDAFSYTTAQYNTSLNPLLKISFSGPVAASSVAGAVTLTDFASGNLPVITQLLNDDSVLSIRPAAALKFLTKYGVSVNTVLKSASGGVLTSNADVNFITKMDSSRKFPAITDDSLLTLVQKQTFKYFWDFAHPVSGLARERNTSGDVCTSGGTGFGIMALPVAVNRNFISRAQALQRMQTIVTFLKNTAVKVKGAFPHWINGATGAIVAFSANDNGADLVETSYLMMGLLSARQYFNNATTDEVNLRNDINLLYNNVEWDWFRQGTQNVLYWHYSVDKGWAMNLKIQGWNECLITYVLAAASSTHGIPASVYTNGWAGNSSFTNGNSYYGYNLPLGPAYGGPLFFSHYSFLGINPNGLTDGYASYSAQTKNHSLINYTYCRNNAKGWYGYSDSVWGLTASDIPGGYTASSPTNDIGVIAPTAALSSIPYTPAESIKALRFFYYVLGDKIFKDYGFTDAFSLKDSWFADSFLAIDQGPIIVMIENYRTQLLWNLFTSCPEVKNGMKNLLGFTAPYL